MNIHMSGVALNTLAASDWSEEEVSGVGKYLKAHLAWILKDLPHTYSIDSWYMTKEKVGDWHRWEWHTDVTLDGPKGTDS